MFVHEWNDTGERKSGWFSQNAMIFTSRQQSSRSSSSGLAPGGRRISHWKRNKGECAVPWMCQKDVETPLIALLWFPWDFCSRAHRGYQNPQVLKLTLSSVSSTPHQWIKSTTDPVALYLNWKQCAYNSTCKVQTRSVQGWAVFFSRMQEGRSAAEDESRGGSSRGLMWKRSEGLGR